MDNIDNVECKLKWIRETLEKLEVEIVSAGGTLYGMNTWYVRDMTMEGAMAIRVAKRIINMAIEALQAVKKKDE